MDKTLKEGIAYFQVYKEYFWKWTQDAAIIEWSDGLTICYKEDLLSILKGLCNSGLPPLGSVLLCIAACQESWAQTDRGRGILVKIMQDFELSASKENRMPEFYVREATEFMDLIRELPPRLRKGKGRIHLIQEIFKGALYIKSPEIAQHLVRDFEQNWGLDNEYSVWIQKEREFDRRQFVSDLVNLGRAYRRYPTVQALQNKLQTGMDTIPAPDKVNLPEVEESLREDLWMELSQDQKTKGLASISQRLIPAFNIPRHLKGYSDQSYGGISDISNRGDFDKLLLSELAHDDLVLMARLVNQEALYHHNEKPPENMVQRRIILIDSTLKMWGMQRIFALAAGMACALHPKFEGSTEAYALGSTKTRPIDLQSKIGIMDALSALDAGLDSHKVLMEFLDKEGTQSRTEIFLISGDNWLEAEFVQKNIQALQQKLNFLISLNRTGKLELYQFLQGRRKLINQGQYDLNQLYFDAKGPKRPAKSTNELPAFMESKEAPMYFPTIGMRLSRTNSISVELRKGIVGIDEANRLLYWSQHNLGAKEIQSWMPRGRYFFGRRSDGKVVLLHFDPNSNNWALYILDLSNLTLETIELEGQFDMSHNSKIWFKGDHFYLQDYEQTHIVTIPDLPVISFNAHTGKISEFKKMPPKVQLSSETRMNSSKNKKLINNGYTALKRVNRVAISKKGLLMLDNRQISLWFNKRLYLHEKNGKDYAFVHPIKNGEEQESPFNPLVKLRTFHWKDGSRIIIDSRGLIHLISSDPDVPEISLTLVVGQRLGAWASDGVYSGAAYFTGQNAYPRLDDADFLEQYIKRYTEVILNYGT